MIDLSANTGYYSFLFKNIEKQLATIDGVIIYINGLNCKIGDQKFKYILHSLYTLRSPSPAIDMNKNKRDSFNDRMKVDLILAIILVNHF